MVAIVDKNILARPFWYLSNRGYRHHVNEILFSRFGYVNRHWLRVEQDKSIGNHLRSLPFESMDLLEISPGDKKDWANIGFKTYTATDFPEFDICAETLDQTFDVIVSDHVFEHLEHPLQAARNIFEMLKPGGHFVIAVPFLVKIHGRPYDFNRWTPDGLMRLLKNTGFTADTITIQSWGNRKCLKANLDFWKIYGWYKDMTNEPDYPQVVWGWARKG